MKLETTAASGPVVALSAVFRAARREVFEAWTQPAHVAKWFMATPGALPPMVELDLQELGRWSILVRPSTETEPSLIQGHFLQVAPRRELTYSWHGNIPGGAYFTLVNVRFEDEGMGSALHLTQGVFRNEADRAARAADWELSFQAFAATLGESQE